jgi:uncharacterized Fe-S cluster-containing radical SAM superfamily enzyme
VSDAQIQTYTARFFPFRPTQEVKTFVVPVQWWAYDNDRLDGRGDAKLTKANVKVKAQDPSEARKLVFREWGDYATVGSPTEVISEGG